MPALLRSLRVRLSPERVNRVLEAFREQAVSMRVEHRLRYAVLCGVDMIADAQRPSSKEFQQSLEDKLFGTRPRRIRRQDYARRVQLVADIAHALVQEALEQRNNENR